MLIDAVLTGGPAQAGEQARAMEDAGLDGVLVPEAQHDGLVTAALAGAATDRLAIATGVAIAFARTPMAMAYAAHDVHEVTGGRFTLGLGSQIRPHIERRYGMPWSAPAARMREYVEALRAIWGAWAEGTPLDFRGDFYQHTLMTPMFVPAGAGAGPPVHVAAVGPEMIRVAAEVGDGIMCHPLATADFVAAHVRPVVEAADRPQPAEVRAWAMVCTGTTEDDLASAVEVTRAQIAFYGSTPAYVPMLAHHGDEGVQPELHRLSKDGQWSEMAALVDDDMLHRYAVVGDPTTVARELQARYEGVVDRLTIGLMAADPAAIAGPIVDALRGPPGPTGGRSA